MFREKKCFSQKVNSNNCIMEKSYSEFSALEKTEMFIELFKSKWATWTIGICGWSILFIFGAGIIAELTKSGDFDIFRELSSWVGFILGIVATLFSIISMFLSFYNLEKEREAKEENEKIMNEMTKNINRSLEKVNEILKENQKELLDKIVILEKKADQAYNNNNNNEFIKKSNVVYKNDNINMMNLGLMEDKNK